ITTSTPLASGSSVPAWPTCRVPRRRRTRATMSKLVGPEGLSRMRTPCGVAGGRGASALTPRTPLPTRFQVETALPPESLVPEVELQEAGPGYLFLLVCSCHKYRPD